MNSNNSRDDLKLEDLIDLAPDQDDEVDDATRYRPQRKRKPDVVSAENQDTAVEAAPAKRKGPRTETDGDRLSEALRWALDSMQHPSLASADWLARDIDSAQATAVGLLTSPSLTLAQVRQAKIVFKTMRIVGEKAADRRIGARMYAAAIAAGLVRFRKRVSTQSDDALSRGFQGLLDDRHMPGPLRDLAGQALCVLREIGANGQPLPESDAVRRSKSA